MAALVCVASALFAVTMLLPCLGVFESYFLNALLVNFLAGIFSIVVSMIVVTFSWYILECRDYPLLKPLIFGFTLVAGCDLAHIVICESIISLPAEGGTRVAFFLWLSGRVVEIVTLLLVAINVPLAGSRGFWLGAGGGGAVIVYWVALHTQGALPITHFPSIGFALCLASVVVACCFFIRFWKKYNSLYIWLGMACFVKGMGDLYFNGLADGENFAVILGGVYKIAACVFICQAAALIGVHEPYEMLIESGFWKRNTDRELAGALKELSYLKGALDAHAIVAFTDRKGVITRVNERFCSISKYSADELVGRTHSVVNSGFHSSDFFKELWGVISLGSVWSGEICNRAKDGTLYWVQTTIIPLIGAGGVPEQYVAIRTDITKRKQVESEARHMALHDGLTGLPNRTLMLKKLYCAVDVAVIKRCFGAVLILDLDHFKEINDTLGHHQGDEVLKIVAGRLQQTIRNCDIAARLGGDEFVVVLEDVGESQKKATINAGNVGEKIRAALAKPFHIGLTEVLVTPSIGLVLFGERASEPAELVKQADIALYRAKELGRNQVCFFDQELQARVVDRSLLLSSLRQAQENDELYLLYQPVVNFQGYIVGVEALVRWQHPQRGLILPGAFIPLAEQSGLINTIGHWVIESACRQLAFWKQDPDRRKWRVSVNVSAKQLSQDDFVEKVSRALFLSGAPANRLFLELTESMLHEHLEELVAKIKTLQSLGVRFSLDDFGTGYSSLSYLKSLPLEQLKIDKSFVKDVLSDPNDAAIVKTILSLAGILEVEVVAEGVETEEQMKFLLNNGCRLFQGYLFCRPSPVESLPIFVKRLPD